VIEGDTDCVDRVGWGSEVVGSSSSGITVNFVTDTVEDLVGCIEICSVNRVIDVIPSWLVKVVEDTLLKVLKGEPVTLEILVPLVGGPLLATGSRRKVGTKDAGGIWVQ